MVVVSGCRRSGTSLWMQILIAAGFPYIGKPFMHSWKKSIYEANQYGFYESEFRNGIYFETNPDPVTGIFIPPLQTQLHAVKIFASSLNKTDISYLHRVIHTIRHWKEHCFSFDKLSKMENAHYKTIYEKQFKNINLSIEEIIQLKNFRVHPAIEWFNNNYSFIQDMALRGYATHCVSYDKLLEKPKESISKTIKWCYAKKPSDIRYLDNDLYDQSQYSFKLNLDSAYLAVKHDARTYVANRLGDIYFPFCDQFSTLFDKFYECFNSENPVIPQSILKELQHCSTFLYPYVINKEKEHQGLVTKTLSKRNVSKQQFQQIENTLFRNSPGYI